MALIKSGSDDIAPDWSPNLVGSNQSPGIWLLKQNAHCKSTEIGGIFVKIVPPKNIQKQKPLWKYISRLKTGFCWGRQWRWSLRVNTICYKHNFLSKAFHWRSSILYFCQNNQYLCTCQNFSSVISEEASQKQHKRVKGIENAKKITMSASHTVDF